MAGETRAWHYLLPHVAPLAIWRHRSLVGQLTRRALAARFRGSMLGTLWSVILPLVMLTVYSFVFGVVFTPRWDLGPGVSRVGYALVLFCGLIVFNVFSESVAAAPAAIVTNPGYVKKVVFPVEVLPVVNLAVAMTNALIGVGILLVGLLVFEHRFPVGLVYLPLTLAPLVMLSLGASWFLASMGVYVRDSTPLVTVMLQMLFFLTPLFYPISQVPPRFQVVMHLNPLTTIVDGGRRSLMYDLPPDWRWLGIVTAGSAVVMLLGYAWFMKTKPGFADVV